MPNTVINRRVVFSGGQGSSAPTASVLQPWYDSLSVKPSAGLWADLQTMADGMNTDGDWEEMDFLSMVAAMETDEQRLRPLKTSSGDDMVTVGTPTLDSTGAVNPSVGDLNYIDTKWNPFDNGVKYTLSSAFIGIYCNTVLTGTASIKETFGSSYNSDQGSAFFVIQSTSTSVTNNVLSKINSDTSISSASKTGMPSGDKRYFASLKRQNSNNVTKYINGISNNGIIPPISLSIYDLIILGVNFDNTIVCDTASKFRSAICGSGLISESRVSARLNTFFTARGLSIFT